MISGQDFEFRVVDWRLRGAKRHVMHYLAQARVVARAGERITVKRAVGAVTARAVGREITQRSEPIRRRFPGRHMSTHARA